MLRVILALAFLALTVSARAEEPPLVEKYLHSGDLINWELALEAALAKAPTG